MKKYKIKRNRLELVAIILFSIFACFILILLSWISNNIVYINDNLIMLIWIIFILITYSLQNTILNEVYKKEDEQTKGSINTEQKKSGILKNGKNKNKC